MEEDILKLAMELGSVGEGQEQGLLPCCRLAVAELNGRLRPGVAAEDCGGVFPAAAAQMALADWLVLQDCGQPRKFTAGELTVEQGGGDPQALRRQALRQMAPYLTDPGFLLRGVRG